MRGGKTTEIDLDLPMDRVAPERFAGIDKLAETRDGAVVIMNHYASRDDGRCADGREVFVHVVSIPQRKSLFDRLVASCVDGIAPPEPYASVDRDVLTIGDERFSVSAGAVARRDAATP